MTENQRSRPHYEAEGPRPSVHPSEIADLRAGIEDLHRAVTRLIAQSARRSAMSWSDLALCTIALGWLIMVVSLFVVPLFGGSS